MIKFLVTSHLILQIITESKRRLYIGSEFSDKSGLHINLKDRFCIKKNICGNNSIHIIDSNSRVHMIDDEDTNIALSKSDFDDKEYRCEASFEEVNYQNFKLVIDIVEKIIKS